jgi:glycosyltransferase involved in cell wall biosynthesis
VPVPREKTAPPAGPREDDRADLRERIDELRRQVDELQGALAAERGAGERRQRDHDELTRRHQLLEGLVLDHRHSRVYRAMVRLGRWRPFERRVQEALGERRSRPAPPGSSRLSWTFESYGKSAGAASGSQPIAVDLTALRPGGENGGAKVVATGLVRAFGRLAPERDFLVLTSEACHEELAGLDAANVRRRAVAADPDALARLFEEERPALLFCPVTAPLRSDPRVPLICQVNDLQYLTYPEFFGDLDRGARDDAFRRAVAWSDRVVTGSHYVKRTVLERSSLGEDQVAVVANGLWDRLPDLADGEVDAVLDRLGLERERFFFYPANFWPHKNHRMLLTAFAQFRRLHPESGLRLVLTGAERPSPEPVNEAVRHMDLGGAVRVLGWVSDVDLAALLSACRALIFPSLYEGFGMPVVEAMARGRPVSASDVTSLPEVAGGAALLFDPRKPGEIAAAMARLASDGELVATLCARGRERVREIGGSARMARVYLDVISETLAAPRHFRDRLAGVWGDGWTPGSFVVSHAADGAGQMLELGLGNPRDEAVVVEARAGEARRRATVEPRQSLVLHCRLPGETGCLELDVHPTFRPADRGFSSDTRRLGLELWACRLSRPGGDVDLLARMHDG